MRAPTLLSDALNKPITNLQSTLEELADDLAVSIHMYLGLTIAVRVHENHVVANTLNPTSTMPVASSLTLSLLPPGAAAASGRVVLYSGARGAFDLIAKGCSLDLRSGRTPRRRQPPIVNICSVWARRDPRPERAQ